MTRREAAITAAGAAAAAAAAGAESQIPELCTKTATELAALLRAKKVSAMEVLEAHLKQIERVNPIVNAIVTLVPDLARAAAKRADEALASTGKVLGPLHGLPIAHKDLQDTAGIRTTYGSPLYRDHVPKADSLTIEHLKKAGVVTLGKTNTPEFGAGSNTFNRVFGATHNPWDLKKTCGGSSGGAAVSLATRMLPIADGSDYGGSLRNPAAWNNVVGFRTSMGRVPAHPAHFGGPVNGPMARTVVDIALMLTAMAGPDTRAPHSILEPASLFARPLAANVKGRRVAWFKTMGGIPFDPEVRDVVNAQRKTFESLGFVVEEVDPDFADADVAFKVQRAWISATGHGEELRKNPDAFKPTLAREISEGLRVTGADLARADAARTALYLRMRTFLEKYAYYVAPVTQVPPFDQTVEYPMEINGTKLEGYIDWMKSCWFISATGLPSIAMPAGFTKAGLPVGLQIVGGLWKEWSVLEAAHAYEQATGFSKRIPAVAGV